MNSTKQSMHTRGVLLLVLVMGWAAGPSFGLGSFGFPIHHRFSDPVKQILDVGNGDILPEKGTASYFAALTHRDNVLHGRRLAGDQTLVTFSAGNTTYRIGIFGFLHYANVTIGTPGLSFLVALDTGSDLFWIPCDCVSCVRGILINNQEIDFETYSLNTSSSGTKVPCSSSLCGHHTSCTTSTDTCPYRIMYLSSNTSSSGFLVEDVLHLTANDNPSEPVNAKIPFGCGKVQTGSFLSGGAPNGLLGLGLDKISVPSMLASQNIAADSFSMCFGNNGTGRITFGDKGSSDQGETPFNLKQPNPHYNISIARISVGMNVSKTDGIYAIFDTGTSFTYLSDPAYTLITESFDSQVKYSRYTSDPNIPFEYCYDLSSQQSSLNIPAINLTMESGDLFNVIEPTVKVSIQSGTIISCLGIVKSDDVDIIGQNFMTGYRVVFDRERMVLGWKASNCNELLESNTLPISPQSRATQIPPISAIEPQATFRNTTRISEASLPHLNSLTLTVITFILLQFLSFV